jgi:hypothetical protein
MMSPNGAALLSGAKTGATMLRQRQANERAQAAAEASARNAAFGQGRGMFSDQLELNKALNEDVDDYAAEWQAALPGDEARLQSTHAALQGQYAQLGVSFPPLSIFSTAATGGFGNRAEPTKMFDSEAARANQNVAAEVERFIYEVPVAQLSTPEGLAAAQQALTANLKAAGVGGNWGKVYNDRLAERATTARAGRDEARKLWGDRQTYVNREMTVVTNLAASAYRVSEKGGGFVASFSGEPTGGLDIEQIAPFNIVRQEAGRLLRESYEAGAPMDAYQAIAAIAANPAYVGNKQIQKAVGTMMKVDDRTSFNPITGAVQPTNRPELAGESGTTAPTRSWGNPPLGTPPATTQAAAADSNSAASEAPYAKVIAQGTTNGQPSLRVQYRDGSTQDMTPAGWENLKAKLANGGGK